MSPSASTATGFGPTSGPLHVGWVFPLSGTLLPWLLAWLIPSRVSGLPCHLLREALLDCLTRGATCGTFDAITLFPVRHLALSELPRVFVSHSHQHVSSMTSGTDLFISFFFFFLFGIDLFKFTNTPSIIGAWIPATAWDPHAQ